MPPLTPSPRNTPVQGLRYLVEGITLLVQPGLRRFVLVPLAINVALFSLGAWYAYEQLAALLAWLDNWLPTWLQWLETLIIPLFLLAATMVIFSTFTLLANLVAAPFNGVLAERVEFHLTGELPPKVNWGRVLAAMPATVWDEAGKLGYLILMALPILVLFFIPGINILAPFLWAVVNAWLLAVGYLDFPMGNHGLSGGGMRRLLRQRWLVTLGFGGGVMVMTMIPGVNFLAMPAAVAGGTALWVGSLRPLRDAL